MMPVDFAALAQQCAPSVHPTTLQAVVRTESGFNPYAIGVVGGRLARQPRNVEEAVATARALEAGGWNYSVGLGQVNRGNFARYGLDVVSAFDPCANLRAGAAILSDCYTRALSRQPSQQKALLASFSCYYSGNFERGFRADFGGTSYVQRVAANVSPAAASAVVAAPIQVIPEKTSIATAAPHAGQKVGKALSQQPTADLAPAQRGWDAFGSFRR